VYGDDNDQGVIRSSGTHLLPVLFSDPFGRFRHY
jgi:hypothetical protein